MAQDLNLFLGLTHINPVAQGELGADSEFAEHRPGTMSMMMSAFGPVMYKYTRDQQGSMLKGQLASQVTIVTGTVTNAAGEINDTLHAADTTNLTAVDEEGKIFHVTDNNDSAGAAPEGEVAIIIKNTTTQMTFDPGYPLSTAPAVSDTYANISTFHMEDSANGDFGYYVLGVVMADRTTDYYGWVQFYGHCPGALYDTGGVTALAPAVATTAAVNAHGSDLPALWVGYAPNTIEAGLADPFRSLLNLDLLTTIEAIEHA